MFVGVHVDSGYLGLYLPKYSARFERFLRSFELLRDVQLKFLISGLKDEGMLMIERFTDSLDNTKRRGIYEKSCFSKLHNFYPSW